MHKTGSTKQSRYHCWLKHMVTPSLDIWSHSACRIALHTLMIHNISCEMEFIQDTHELLCAYILHVEGVAISPRLWDLQIFRYLVAQEKPTTPKSMQTMTKCNIWPCASWNSVNDPCEQDPQFEKEWILLNTPPHSLLLNLGHSISCPPCVLCAR